MSYMDLFGVEEKERLDQTYSHAQRSPGNTSEFLQLVIIGQLAHISKQLTMVTKKETQIVSALDDLKAAVTAETDEITKGNQVDAQLLADIDAAVTKITTPGTNDADISAAAASIQNATATLKANNDANAAAAAKIEAALNPAPPANL